MIFKHKQRLVEVYIAAKLRPMAIDKILLESMHHDKWVCSYTSQNNLNFYNFNILSDARPM
jgi:hypothetical protein